MKAIKFLLSALCAVTLLASCEEQQETPTPTPNDPTADSSGTFSGTMNVDQTDGTFFTQEDLAVEFEVVDATTMTIKMNQAQFAAAMPLKLDMTIEGVSYTLSGEKYTLTGDNIVPIAMNGPFPQYTITALSGTIDDKSMTLAFNCGKYPVEYHGTM